MTIQERLDERKNNLVTLRRQMDAEMQRHQMTVNQLASEIFRMEGRVKELEELCTEDS